METKDRQIKFWQMFSAIAFLYSLASLLSILLLSFEGPARDLGSLGFVFGGLLATGLIITPLAYWVWVIPSAKAATPTHAALKELRRRYWINLAFCGLVFLVLVGQAALITLRGWTEMMRGFWWMAALAVFGLANLAAVLRQAWSGSRTAISRSIRDARRKRWLRWSIFLLAFAALWAGAAFGWLPGVSETGLSLTATLWLLGGAAGALIYGVGFPREM